MTGMARPLQFQSAVLHCDSQTRPAPTGCGHQMSAAQGCDIPVRELQSAPSGNHRCQRQQFKTVAAIRCQCQHSHSVAAIASRDSLSVAEASSSRLWPRDASKDPSSELQSAPPPAVLTVADASSSTLWPPRAPDSSTPAVLTVAVASSSRLWPSRAPVSSTASCSHSGRCQHFYSVAPRAPDSSYASCFHSGRCQQCQNVALRAPVSSTTPAVLTVAITMSFPRRKCLDSRSVAAVTSSPRCQCLDSYSVAAITITSSPSAPQGTPCRGGRRKGDKHQTKCLYCGLQSLLQPASSALSTLHHAPALQSSESAQHLYIL